MTGEKPAGSLPILKIAIWFAAVAGLLEGALFLVLQSLGWQTWDQMGGMVDENILWASPAMNGLLFLSLGIVIVFLQRVFRRLPWGTITVFILSMLSFYSFLSISGRLRERGAVMLAVGLAAVIARLVSRNPPARLAIFPRTLAPVLVVTLTVGIASYGWAGIRERIERSRLPEPSPQAPDVLLIVLDTLRADRLGAYGYSRPTSPFLDGLAADSVQFDAAFSTSSWTPPSHASMFTGRLPSQHRLTLFPKNLESKTLAEVLAQNGYATAGFVSNNLVSKAFGLGKGVQYAENKFYSLPDSLLRTAYGRKFFKYFLSHYAFHPRLIRMDARQVSSRFLRWLDARPDRPFFAFLNFMEMHEPHVPPQEYARRFSSAPEKIISLDGPTISPRPTFRNEEERRAISSDGYDASLAFLDAQLEQLFEELARRGRDKNLIVIVTADHGEAFGEHGLDGHRHSLYLEQIHVPLLIQFAGHTPRGARVDQPVGLERLPKTVLDLAGIPSAAFPDNSLVPFWSAAEAPSEAHAIAEVSGGDWPGVLGHWPIRQGWLKAIVEGQWHLILKQNGEVELFDWRADPREENNLAAQPELQPVVARLRALLEKTSLAQ